MQTTILYRAKMAAAGAMLATDNSLSNAEEGGMARFQGHVRRWREDKPGGLAVIDIPIELAAELGGRRQMRMAGSLNGVPFTGSTMLVAGGGFCVGVSRAALQAAGLAVGDDADVELEPVAGEQS